MGYKTTGATPRNMAPSSPSCHCKPKRMTRSVKGTSLYQPPTYDSLYCHHMHRI